MPQSKKDPKLARGWPASKVQFCLDKKRKRDLVSFLNQRFEDRFFEPIRVLARAPRNTQGYGFAIMALCALLVESIQSFRLGLPSSYEPDLRNLHRYAPPRDVEVPRAEWRNGHQVFEEFFREPKHKKLFPGIDGAKFCKNIRDGLLHQAQTKDGWTITTAQRRLCAIKKRTINRNLFAERLQKAFRAYIGELRKSPWDDHLWQKTRRKIWWLVKLSQPMP